MITDSQRLAFVLAGKTKLDEIPTTDLKELDSRIMQKIMHEKGKHNIHFSVTMKLSFNMAVLPKDIEKIKEEICDFDLMGRLMDKIEDACVVDGYYEYTDDEIAVTLDMGVARRD